METQLQSPDTASPADDVEPPVPPYPPARGDIAVWLRRGERLGRAGRWIVASLAAARKRPAWRRHVASKGPVQPPPVPG